jgi:hypothetical protein
MSFVSGWNPWKDLKMMRAKDDDPAQTLRNPIWFEQLKKEMDITASHPSKELSRNGSSDASPTIATTLLRV